MSIIVQRDANIYSLFIAANCSTCFGCWHHPSSGAHINVFTAYVTVRIVWAANSRSVSIHPRQRELAAQTLRPIPDALNTVIRAPVDGWCQQPKHVEQFAAINKSYIVASRWTIINVQCKLCELVFRSNWKLRAASSQSVVKMIKSWRMRVAGNFEHRGRQERCIQSFVWRTRKK